MIDWFARHQTAANLLMSAIVILGLVSLGGLQRETLPEIESDESRSGSSIGEPPRKTWRTRCVAGWKTPSKA